MNQRGFSSIIISILAILILGGAGYYFLSKTLPAARNSPPSLQSQDVQNPPPTPNRVENETVGWKTYRNDKYGFEMKYPQEWFFKQCKFFVAFSPKTIECDNDEQSDLIIAVSQYANAAQAKDLYTKLVNELIKSPNTFVENIKIDNEAAVKLVAPALAPKAMPNTKSSNIIFFHNSYVYIATYFEEPDKSEDFKIFYQMLTTFKFTK